MCANSFVLVYQRTFAKKQLWQLGVEQYVQMIQPVGRIWNIALLYEFAPSKPPKMPLHLKFRQQQLRFGTKMPNWWTLRKNMDETTTAVLPSLYFLTKTLYGFRILVNLPPSLSSIKHPQPFAVGNFLGSSWAIKLKRPSGAKRFGSLALQNGKLKSPFLLPEN